MRRWYTKEVLAIAIAVVIAVPASKAVTIVNQTTGEVLFLDTFETAPNGVSQTAYPDTSGDYDPVAETGSSWGLYETGGTNVQVVSYMGDGTHDPAANPQGTNYLRIVRHQAGMAEARAIFPLQSDNGDLIHAEFMVWLPEAVNNYGLHLRLDGAAGASRVNVGMWANSSSGGAVVAYDATLASPAWVDTTLVWLKNTWQKWEIDYEVGGTNFVLTIDGVEKTLPRSGAAGDVATLAFRGGSSGDNVQCRIDSTGYTGVRQESFTLFSDGFESGTADSSPAYRDPDIGTYTTIGSGVKVRSGDLSASGGPSAAYSGTNYVEMTRLGGLGLNISCMFAGGAVDPTNQFLRTRFHVWWAGAGLPGQGIGNDTTQSFSQDTFLTYNLMRSDYSYDAYSGSAYVEVAPAASIPTQTWTEVEITWDPATEISTLSIDGGQAYTNELFGNVPETLDRLFIASGISTTIYWADDIEVSWVYTPPPPPPPKGTLIMVQ